MDCDIYCAFGVNSVSASVIATAKQREVKSLFFLQSNFDVDINYITKPDCRNKYGVIGSVCLFTLKEADAIFSQTERQSQWLSERFDRKSV